MNSKWGLKLNIKRYRKQVIFAIDLMIIVFIFIGLFFVQSYGVGTNNINIILVLPHLGLLLVCSIIFQLVFKTYDSLWRFAESKEYLTLILGAVSGYISYLFLGFIVFKSHVSFLFSLAVFSISLLVMLFMRFSYRIYRKSKMVKNIQARKSLAIIGAGAAGVKLLEEIQNNPNSIYEPYCFFDDSVEKIGKTIHNIKINGPIKDIPILLKDTPINEIIIAIPSITPEKRRKILEICSSIKCRVKILPNILTLIQNNSMPLSNSVRDVKIEELLGRESVVFDNGEVENFISDKVVMVTGGGGSIGSELCRQIAGATPKKLIIVDINENSAYDLQQELRYTYSNKLDLKIEIASIRDKKKINLLFQRYRPNIVFHAAAHKHVPLMEGCPEEAIKNNIFGTYNVVCAADKWCVEKFVLISTDKAVNPTNIMGASKRLCEMIIQSMEDISDTEYVAVRFGNVLGSSGSVVPLFKRQIEHGGPVTITDKRIIRYFMTIPEAAQLVLQAGSMANRSEIYVLDMGKPVKILNLAENLIKLSGYEPYTEIQIKEIGLRPGEKLYEELLMRSEDLVETSNHKIFIEKQKKVTKDDINEKLAILEKALDTKLPLYIINAMKSVVPTYRDPEEINCKIFISDYHNIINKNSSKAAIKTVI